MQNDDHIAERPQAALVRALRHLLRPLVRLLIARGITFPALASLLKSVYVEVAEKDFRLSGKPQTDSRINLLTGIHRKDVKRLRAELASGHRTDVPASVSLGAQLVARWSGMPDYTDEQGSPLPLPRQADDAVSFERLVASVNKDIRPRVVLDEWLRLGIVHIDENDRVVLDTGAFVPDDGFEELAHYFGRNLHDHIATAAHNIDGGHPRRLERSVYYDGLRRESVARLEALARDEGMKALQAVNREALVLQMEDRGQAGSRHRINFGVYFHDAATDDSSGEAS